MWSSMTSAWARVPNPVRAEQHGLGDAQSSSRMYDDRSFEQPLSPPCSTGVKHRDYRAFGGRQAVEAAWSLAPWNR